MKGISYQDENLTRYFKTISEYPLQTKEEEIQTARDARLNHNKDSLDLLVTSNLRYVITMAKRYVGQGLYLSDIIQEGNIGLTKAAERFDERRGFRFISYATWWVRQSILEALGNQQDPVRIPRGLRTTFYAMNKYINNYQVKNKKPPLDQLLIDKFDVTKETLRTFYQFKGNSCSLDKDDDEKQNLHERIPNRELNPFEIIESRNSSEFISNDMLNSLSPRKRLIIHRYYYEGNTLEKIGQELGLTRERIRQIKEKALIELRNSKELRQLA
ncbi:RNA polymerase sigma factor RpoD/SigA [archaeon]|nr:RNA polymerase sigma factor RpoD/SigA [archaeon]